MTTTHRADWFAKYAKDSEKDSYESLKNGPPHLEARTPKPGRLLVDTVRFIQRFVAFASDHQTVAVALWAVHAHLVECFDSSPRLALLSPEAGSGKTRTLEVLDLLVPKPMHALNASPAPIFRSIEDLQPTLLFDEIDAIFTKRGKDDSAEDLRALLNAGHRKGATIPRCVGPRHEVQQFPVYAAAALAGLGDLPETLMTRSVIVRMRKRSPKEHIEPFRHRVVKPEGDELRARLATWADTHRDTIGNAWPTMPEGVTDRPADCWEPLLAIADAMGGHWPARAREACVELCKVVANRDASLGVKLLTDLREIFGEDDHLSTNEIIDRLTALEESPWADLRGKRLDARGLARRLKPYGVTSKTVRVGDQTPRGYERADLFDPWDRYLSPTPAEAQQVQHAQPGRSDAEESVALTLPVAQHATEAQQHKPPLTCDVASVADVADLRGAGPEDDLGAYTSDVYDEQNNGGPGQPPSYVDENGKRWYSQRTFINSEHTKAQAARKREERQAREADAEARRLAEHNAYVDAEHERARLRALEGLEP